MTNTIAQLKKIIGDKHCVTDAKKTAPYRKGVRFGFGEAIAVIFPNTLIELWRSVQCCVDNDVIMIMQAANTGVTGGSTPDGDYDRDVVIISTVRLNDLQIINDGQQVLAFPGSRLYELENLLAPYGREPHSVIGSSCIGASIVGGVCNNSGGALVNRGPAYTEMALYARINKDGTLSLVNHLGVRLGDDPEQMLRKLEQRTYQDDDIEFPEYAASNPDYSNRVRDVDADTPARFNNDESRLFEASGCAGKLIVFALRLDTFEKAKKDQVFYIGTNDTEVLTKLRRHILGEFKTLPIAGEYLHRDYFDACDKYGKDTFIVINRFGSNFMPKLFRLKNTVDRWCSKVPLLPANIADKILQGVSHLFPDHLPKFMREYRAKYEHHLMLHMSDDGVDEAKIFLKAFFSEHAGEYRECSKAEGEKAFLHRFVAGGASVRHHIMHRKQCGEFMTLDIALRRNEEDWFERLPPELDKLFYRKLYCAHFLCHVMHQEYLLNKGVDAEAVKAQVLEYLDAKGAEYPAEHNVGQIYAAKPALAQFYRDNDPTNSLNPGIGKTAKYKHWSQTKCCDKC